MRNVSYGKRLHKMKISETPLCYHCLNHKEIEVEESIMHLYWECPASKRLWERLKLILTTTLNWDLQLTPEVYLFNLNPAETDQKLHKSVLNILSLLVKNYINICKCLDTPKII